MRSAADAASVPIPMSCDRHRAGPCGLADAWPSRRSSIHPPKRLARRCLACVAGLAIAAAAACRGTATVGDSAAAAPPPPFVCDWASPASEEGIDRSDPSALAEATAPKQARTISLAGGIEVDRDAGEIRVAAQVALDAGWLEQAVCKAGTREHESVLVVDLSPRLLHAALLLLGAEAGAPGAWRSEGDPPRIVRVPPRGTRLAIFVRVAGDPQERPLSSLIRRSDPATPLPAQPWVFAGSLLEQGAYAAEFSGSVVGLVTFGDEVVAYEAVLADQEAVEEPSFLVREGALPPSGTPVTLVIRLVE